MLLFILSFVFSCGNYEEFKEDPNSLLTGIIPGESISFERVKNEVLQPRCIKCHGDYGDYQVVKAKINAITALVRIDVMPKDGPLEAGQKQLLLAWSAAGAPQNGGVTAPSPNPNPGPPQPPAPPRPPVPTPPSQDLDFATIQARVLRPHCMNCHGNFGDYTTVKNKIDIIVDKVRTDQMPLGSKLAADLKTILFQWAADGAPQTGTGPNPNPTPPTPGPVPVPVPLEPTFKSINFHILQKKCIACHNPNGRARFLDMSSYQAIRANQGRLFDFRRPERSDIVDEITDDEEPMPPRSSSFSPVTAQELKTLIQWIRNGIPNN
jgi:mono/diheme cytochrome c family protein